MISVIVILYYSEHLLKELLDNLRNVIGSDLGEIILVNNSKHENLDDYKSELVKVVYNEKNYGYGAGMNLGVSLAKYDSLLLINPDLRLERFNFVTCQDKPFLVGGFNNALPYGSNFPSLCRDTLRITIKRIFPFNCLNFVLDVPHTKIIKDRQYVDYFSGSLILTNRNTFNLLNGFDPNFFLFYEEIDLCKRAAEKKIKVFITKEVEYSHKLSSSASNIDVSAFKIECELNSFFKYHEKYSGKLTVLARYFMIAFILILYPFFILMSLIISGRYIKSRQKLFGAYFRYFFKKADGKWAH